MPSLSVTKQTPEPLVEWLEPSLEDTAGRDPLGLNTITLDRILPRLLPGVLQLSQRARYFSIYPWMLWQFADRKRPATGDELDRFIRRREFELCIAIKLCKHCDGAGAVGSQGVEARVTCGEDPFQRGISIKSDKGGFGLYYRSPLSDLGVIAPVGTPLGPESRPTPIEVLRSRDTRVMALSESFHEAIKDTTYYRKYERTNDPIPRQVMEELSESICLCRLPVRHQERDAIRSILFEPADDSPAVVTANEARCRGFAAFLALLDRDPEVASSTNRFRQQLVAGFESNPNAEDERGQTNAPWAALAMKEFVQESLCSIWTHFCRTGIEQQGLDGMSTEELGGMIRQLADGADLALDGKSLGVFADEPAAEAQARLIYEAQDLDWETIAAWTAETNTASSGLASLLILVDRVPDPREVSSLWAEVAVQRSENQDGLLNVAMLVQRRLDQQPSIAELLDWLIRRFIVSTHEVIAYSKLPRATFRFNWEETGRLRFSNPGGSGLGRFEPSDDRRAAMASLTHDLGYWEIGEGNGLACLTSDGKAFVSEVFG